tara:strand:- start:112 stop:366 length:255 start_codon:yes stop_codon:yes gene_type:complete
MSNLILLLNNPKRIGLYTYTAVCPNCKLQLTATKSKFNCRTCKIKGSIKEYEKWLWELDQKRLNHLLEFGLDSKKMSDWWINRY